MATTAISEYHPPAADTQDKFHGAQLLYIGWDHHTMFCAPFCWPFPPDMRFGDIIEHVLPGAFGYHPEFAQIEWDKVTWLRSGRPYTPDFDKSLADNGLRHKDVLRFNTPGLDGLRGSGA